MAWLNYHHLLYFWTVAKEGSIAKACERLRLAQPTISGQLKQLEDALGERLFTKAGRGLALTEEGRLVFQYAEEIFGLGQELQSVLQGGPRKRPQRLMVGISDMVPKLIAYRILQPVLTMADPPKLLCEEDSPERLLTDLVEHRLDVVLSDVPITALTRQRAFNHLLGSCGVTLFGSAALAARYGRDFPQNLNGAPVLFPLPGSNLRRSMERWFDAQGVRPVVAGEFEDSALMKAFGEAGVGIFPGPSAIEQEVNKHYRTKVVGRMDTVSESYYAISVERRLKHPAVAVICEAARGELFAPTRSIV